MTRWWIHVKKTNRLPTGFGIELRRILDPSCSSCSSPRSMTVQRLAGWPLHPTVSQGLDSLLGPQAVNFLRVSTQAYQRQSLGLCLKLANPQGGKHISYFQGDDTGLECLKVNESILPDKFLFVDASGPLTRCSVSRRCGGESSEGLLECCQQPPGAPVSPGAR